MASSSSSAIPHFLLLLLLFLLLFLLSSIASSQTNGTQIAIGKSLIAGDSSSSSEPWLSPSNDFAFGFLNFNDDLFFLSIWFYKIHENTTVWFAKEDKKPILSPKGSKLELTSSNGLILQNPTGEKIWSSEPVTGSVVAGVMRDIGNFVLLDEKNGSVWESFQNPTDTLLPTQKLGINAVLSSRKSPSNYSNGRFQFLLGNDGNVVLNTVNLITGNAYISYYHISTKDSENSQNFGSQVVFDEGGFLYVMKNNGEKVNITVLDDVYPAESFYFKATMNFDGVLTVSSYPKSPEIANRSWKDLSRIPDNICRSSVDSIVGQPFGSGICGYNSYCTINSDGRPICKCPPGYSWVDPNDKYGNCKPDISMTLGCDENSTSANLYQMMELQNTNWPMNDDEFFINFNEEDCKNSCLEDCLCVLVVLGKSGCWRKRPPLSNGRQDVSFTTTVSYFKLRKNTSFESFPRGGQESLPKGGRKKNEATMIAVFSTLLASSVFFIFILAGLKCLGFFALEKTITSVVSSRKSTLECNLVPFSYKDLYQATNGFKEELGRGSCGIVYKGTTEAAGPIAVKKLDRMFEERVKEFRTEVNVIGQTHHKNLVSLLGYCEEGNNRMLVYQFMSNGTLSNFLFNGDDLRPSWELRTQMACGIARGLSYLHEECNTQIIHCDIKPQNILLDDHFNAKISDFGLAKLLKIDQSRTETGIRGTKGYVAPDWFRSSPVNAKVDVYSFGVLLMEIILCRRNVADIEAGQEREILTDWAYDCYKQGRLYALIEGDNEAMDDFERVERFVKVAIWCIQEEPSKRPTIKKALLMLEGTIDVSVPPCPYPFSSTI